MAKLTRDEIVEILHNAEVIGCDPNRRYIIALNSTLVSRSVAYKLSHALCDPFNIRAMIMLVNGDPSAAIAAKETELTTPSSQSAASPGQNFSDPQDLPHR